MILQEGAFFQLWTMDMSLNIVLWPWSPVVFIFKETPGGRELTHLHEAHLNEVHRKQKTHVDLQINLSLKYDIQKRGFYGFLMNNVSTLSHCFHESMPSLSLILAGSCEVQSFCARGEFQEVWFFIFIAFCEWHNIYWMHSKWQRSRTGTWYTS